MSEPPPLSPPVRPAPPPVRPPHPHPHHPGRPHASSWAEAGSERGAGALDEGAREANALALPAAPPSGGQGGGSGGEEEGGSGEADAGAGAEELDWRLQQVADAVGMVCRYEQAQSVWSARIPLDPGLLPETVLHLAYEPGLLSLRFGTTRWWVRDLLKAQLPALQAMVAELLPQGCDASVTL